MPSVEQGAWLLFCHCLPPVVVMIKQRMAVKVPWTHIVFPSGDKLAGLSSPGVARSAQKEGPQPADKWPREEEARNILGLWEEKCQKKMCTCV